jgi:RecT family
MTATQSLSKQVTQTAAKKVEDKQRVSLVEKFGAKWAVEPTKVLGILRGTAFKVKKDEPPATDDELAQLMIVSDIYNLNPFLKELYAYRNKDGRIVPIVGYDGWIKLVQAQPQFDGEELIQGFDEDAAPDGKPKGLYFECRMYRKDRRVPTTIREYHFENYRKTDPWDTMPHRMTRMRAYIQCARVCFGFGGIYDPDEGEKITLATGVDYFPASGKIERPKAVTAEPVLLNETQLEAIREKLGVCGVDATLVCAKYEVGGLNELLFEHYNDVMRFIGDNGGPPD